MKVLSDTITLCEFIDLSLKLEFFWRKSGDNQIESVILLRQLANFNIQFIADIFKISILGELLSELEIFISQFADSFFGDDSNLLVETGIVISQHCISVF